MSHSPSIRYRLRLFMVALAGALVLSFSIVPNSLYEALERTSYDYLQAYLPKLGQEPRILLVDVDEASLREIGPWPWPRHTTAQLLSILTDQYHVGLLGLDMIFSDPRPSDERLKQALSHNAVVLSQTFDFNPDSNNHVGTLVADTLLSEHSQHITSRATGYVANNASILPPLPSIGHITPKLDEDGKVRRISPIICHHTQCSLALSLKLLQRLHQPSAITLSQTTSLLHTPTLNFFPDGPNIPLDTDQSMWIPYRLIPGGFDYLSATDVMHQRIPTEKLLNAVVLLGSTALSLGDRVATPQGNLTPGLEIHAQILSAALDASLITPINLHTPHVLATYLLLVVILVAVLNRYLLQQQASTLLMLCITASLGYLILLFFLFQQFNLLLPRTPIPLLFMLTGLFNLLAEAVRNNRKLAYIAAQSSYFLPAMLVKNLLNEQEMIAGTESKQLSVLVADMRGFTHASEGEPPERVAKLAQKCLETLSEIVVKHGGIIEKYTGDGLMAIWGAEQSTGLHATNALEAAQEMQAAIAGLHDWFISSNFEPMKVSIGINSGNMAVGIFGSAHRAWSAHGDAVNLATRIEQLTRTLGVDLLVGAMTAKLIGFDRFELLGSYPVKGRDETVEVYGVRNP